MPRKKSPTTKKTLKPKVVKKVKKDNHLIKTIKNESHRTLFAALIIIALFGSSYLNNHVRNTDIYRAEFSTPEVEAKAVFVYDVLDKKILIEKNSTIQYPLASLTKIMTSIVALEHLKQDDMILITKEAFDQPEDQGLFVNEEWVSKDLIQFMLTVSSNDASYAIGEKIGGGEKTISLMNLKSNELGLQAKFTNLSGLDTPDSVGGIGSAEDVARLLVYAYFNYPDIWSATSRNKTTYNSLSGFIHEAENTNYNSELNFVLASKTGFTDRAGGNLAVLYNIGLDHPVVAVVLGSTLEGRFSDMKILINFVNANYN